MQFVNLLINSDRMKLVNNESTIILFAVATIVADCKVFSDSFIKNPSLFIILQEGYLRIAVAFFPRYGLSLLEVLHEVLL